MRTVVDDAKISHESYRCWSLFVDNNQANLVKEVSDEDFRDVNFDECRDE